MIYFRKMTDFFGNEVHIGDKVAFIWDRNSLEIGYIVGISDISVGKVDNKPYNENKDYSTRESYVRCVSHYQIIKTV